MMTQTEKLQLAIHESGSTIFFGGAGVSTESGIPDFRSTDGLFMRMNRIPPETILSHGYLTAHPEKFHSFYREALLYPDARPNRAHVKLAEMEAAGKLNAVITQNIDGLHQKAGSIIVLELHGSVERNFCQSCRKKYDAAFMRQSAGIPRCTCGGMVRPDIVLYEELLDSEVLGSAAEYVSKAEVLIVGGSSLVVHPAAGLVHLFNGRHFVIINNSPTPYDRDASLVIRDNICEVFEKIRL
jgi:NAD-dependent deacetylase